MSAAARVEIMITSWAPDANWLTFALRSIVRFASSFAGVTVVYPNTDDAVLRPVCERYGAKGRPNVEPSGKGHLAQNIVKCSADIWCPNATHVLHFDSDCVFVRPATPVDYMRDGKPLLVHRRWEDAADANYWREPTRRALGGDPRFETMAMFPIMYDTRIYSAVRKHIEDTHHTPFEEYVYAQKATFPYGFSEFVTLGNWTLDRAPDLCAPVLVPPWDGLPRKTRQLWSHDGMLPDMREWLEETLRDGEKRSPPAQGGMTVERRKLLGLE